MENCVMQYPNWPSVKSSYIQAYDFEVFNVPAACHYANRMFPWVCLICISYLLLIVAGQRFMKNRKPFELKRPLFYWNFALAIFSIVGFTRVFPETLDHLRKPGGFYSTVCTLNIHNFATGFWAFMFTLSKFFELGDTAFLILRKKPLIFLHWFHHLTVFFVTFVNYMNYDPSFRISGTINFFIHSFMYTYYALMSLNIKLPKKLSITITMLQILQMVAILTGLSFQTYMKVTGVPCAGSWWSLVVSYPVIGTYLALFLNFFYQTYLNKSAPPKVKKQ